MPRDLKCAEQTWKCIGPWCHISIGVSSIAAGMVVNVVTALALVLALVPVPVPMRSCLSSLLVLVPVLVRGARLHASKGPSFDELTQRLLPAARGARRADFCARAPPTTSHRSAGADVARISPASGLHTSG